MANRRGKPVALLLALRPAQWVKNLLVVAPLFFAFGDAGQGLSASGEAATATLRAKVAVSVLAALAFCLVSGAVYIVNDLHDRREDSLHPVKRLRPIASGEVGATCAVALMAVCLAAAAAISAVAPPAFSLALLAYFVFQLAYTFVLKRIALVDVISLALGFVLRAVAGAVAVDVEISPWLILCTFFVSLFLALCKRRQEKVFRDPSEQRKVLVNYSVRLLDLLIAIAATATIIAYSLYTISPKTVEKFGTGNLGLTVPFVVCGVFRYLQLVFVREEGERPEHTLLTDGVIAATVLLYLATFCLLVKFGRGS